MRVLYGRNINSLWVSAKLLIRNSSNMRLVSPRGQDTLEYLGPVASVYAMPQERVLFDPVRDANPYFHFFESLWILAGSPDAKWLAHFNSRMIEYSDDGKVFNAPYGYRLRKHFKKDQLVEVVRILKQDSSSRQAVLQLWDVDVDLGSTSKDIPCNDLVFVKIRDGELHITVCCRSNDVVWGCYGANVVQFSVIQEYLAVAIGVQVGSYTQISDSWHVYIDTPGYQQIVETPVERSGYDPYEDRSVSALPMTPADGAALLDSAEAFIEYTINHDRDVLVDGALRFRWLSIESILRNVAAPMYNSHLAYKRKDRAEATAWAEQILATDWRMACTEWLGRRKWSG